MLETVLPMPNHWLEILGPAGIERNFVEETWQTRVAALVCMNPISAAKAHDCSCSAVVLP